MSSGENKDVEKKQFGLLVLFSTDRLVLFHFNILLFICNCLTGVIAKKRISKTI